MRQSKSRHLSAALLFAMLAVVAISDASAAEIVIKSVKSKAPRGSAVYTYGLKRDDLRRIKTVIPAIESATPVRSIKRRVRYSARTAAATIHGTSPTLQDVTPMKVVKGTFLSNEDTQKLSNVGVISSRLATRLFANKDPIGRNVRVDNHFFRVVGVIDSNQALLYIPITTMRSRIGDLETLRAQGSFELDRYELSEIHLSVPAASVGATVDVLKQLLSKTHETKDYEIERSSARRDERQ